MKGRWILSRSIYSNEEYENEHQIKQETPLEYPQRQLQTQVEELMEENKALLEQHQLLKAYYDPIEAELKNSKRSNSTKESIISSEPSTLYQEALLQNRRQKEQIEKLASALQERDKKIRELQQFEYSYKKNHENKVFLENQLEQERKTNALRQKEIQDLSKKLFEMQRQSEEFEHVVKHLHHIQTEKQEALEEMQALQAQFSLLKMKIIEGQEAIKILSAEKKQLESLLANKNQFVKHMENELSTIKQDVSKGMKETKDIEENYLTLVNEKAVLCNKSNYLEQLLDSHNRDMKNLQQRLEEATKKEESLKIQLEQAEAVFQEKHRGFLSELQKRINELETNLQKHHNQLHEKENEIENCYHQIQQLTQEKMGIEDALSNKTHMQEEQEARIKVAQQHLGKKVREVTLMNEKIHEQKEQMTILEEALNQFKAQMEARENSFEKQLEEEKKNLEKWKESLSLSEAQSAQWKDQSMKVQEQLKILEEKQQQMQTLFASLGHVIGSQPQAPHSALPSPSAKSYISQKNPLPLVDVQIAHNQKFEEISQNDTISFQPTLFDIEQPRKIRQNLFD